MASHSNRSTVGDVLIVCAPSWLAIVAGRTSGMLSEALTAAGLVLPVTLIAHAMAVWLSRRKPSGAALGMIAGTVLRGVVIIGGALVIFTARDAGPEMTPWYWIIGVYLATLTVETMVLVQRLRLQGNF